MLVFIAGLIVFFGIHLVRVVTPGMRDKRLAAMGERRWKGTYSIIALIGFVLIVWGWMQYRPEAEYLYAPPAWGRHVTYLLVLVASILMAAAYTPPGHIKAWVRHPFLTAVGLWALGHLFVNGDMAGLLLFGAFLLYAVIDRIAVAGRGVEAPVAQGWTGDIIAVVLGLAAYVVMLFWLHLLLFGVSPLA